jgi:hypothetical protein
MSVLNANFEALFEGEIDVLDRRLNVANGND